VAAGTPTLLDTIRLIEVHLVSNLSKQECIIAAVIGLCLEEPLLGIAVNAMDHSGAVPSQIVVRTIGITDQLMSCISPVKELPVVLIRHSSNVFLTRRQKRGMVV
jgi:uncharacterized membrane protein